jgi:hypothetical protein
MKTNAVDIYVKNVHSNSAVDPVTHVVSTSRSLYQINMPYEHLFWQPNVVLCGSNTERVSGLGLDVHYDRT